VPGGAKSEKFSALRWTLRRGLILIVVAAMAPVVLVSFLQAGAAQRDARELADSRIIATARAIAERERAAFIIARHLLTVASQDPAIQAMNGECRAGLTRLIPRERNSVIINLARTDASGRPRCSVLPFDPSISFAQESWWRDAIRQPSFSLSAPQMGPISRVRVLLMILPMRSGSGGQDGAVSAALGLAAMQTSIEHMRTGNDGVIALVSKTGETILSSQGGAIRLPLKAVAIERTAIAQSADGMDWIYTLAPLQDRDLFILYAEPRQSVMGATNSNTRAGILLPLVAVMLAAMAVWLGVDRFVVRWLQALQKLANQFARGDFTGDRAGFAGAPIEVEALSGDMHAMAGAIAERDRALNDALETQKRLTREVHHRVKNNLQIVVSLLTMQSARLVETQAATALGQTRARVGALALIHRLMYEEDTSAEAGEVDLADLLGELCRQLRSNYRSISDATLECETGQHAVAADLAVPVAMFVVEAVSNAYHHAFGSGSGGTIRLQCTVADGQGRISIADNGKGYGPATVDRMGTDLMHGFATQLNGKFAIETSSTDGTRVVLEFPLVPFAS
jgi:two-component sensor histidine kinase